MTTVPVALIFFSRPDVLERTFSAIRRAKPKQLFLIQDGPREGKQTDLEKIIQCRNIVKNIDWDCQVYRNFSDENLGCGGRVSSGVSWAFEHVDRLAIIEDDCVPSEGFFTFCCELLEKYKNDERIDMISGMNNLGVYDEVQDDYLFAQEGSIWGWATWKRVWDKIDFEMYQLNDPHTLKLLKAHRGQSFIDDFESFKSRLHRGEKMSSWSLQRGLSMFLNSGLIIVPKKNLITNIGLVEDGANSVSSLKMIPKGMRRIYFMETYPVELPLKHPKYVVRDILFEKELKNIMGCGNKWQKILRQCESMIYRIYYRDERLIQKLKRIFRFGR